MLLNFIGCKFLDLESNAQSGGGIGLLFTNDNDLVLLFENTKFERIKFTHPDYCGGAISFSSEVNQNKKTKLTVSNCLFNDCTSNNGNLFKNYIFDDSDTDIEVSGGIHCSTSDSMVSLTLTNLVTIKVDPFV